VEVLESELLWIWLPLSTLALVLVMYLRRRATR